MHTPLSSSLGSRLLAGVGTLTLLAAVGLFASRPAHTAGGPVPVTVANAPLYAVTQNSDDPGRQPVSVTVNLSGVKGTSEISQVIYTVPAGKRLVIDYVSAGSNNSNDANRYSYFVTTIQNGENQYANFNQLPDGAPYSAVTQKIELFGDPGTNIEAYVYPTANSSTNVELTVTGHLVSL